MNWKKILGFRNMQEKLEKSSAWKMAQGARTPLLNPKCMNGMPKKCTTFAWSSSIRRCEFSKTPACF